MTQKNLWILPASLALIGVILFLIWWLLGSQKTKERQTSGNDTTSNDPTVLQYGDRGNDVKIIQSWINLKTPHTEGSTPLAMDGIFGPKTEAALYAWTKSKVVHASQLFQAKKELGLQS